MYTYRMRRVKNIISSKNADTVSGTLDPFTIESLGDVTGESPAANMITDNTNLKTRKKSIY